LPMEYKSAGVIEPVCTMSDDRSRYDKAPSNLCFFTVGRFGE
jgi:hypothetical protein